MAVPGGKLCITCLVQQTKGGGGQLAHGALSLNEVRAIASSLPSRKLGTAARESAMQELCLAGWFSCTDSALVHHRTRRHDGGREGWCVGARSAHNSKMIEWEAEPISQPPPSMQLGYGAL